MIFRSRSLQTGLILLGLSGTSLSVGCAEDNEAEFLKSLPAVPKNEFAGESVAQRRSRTRVMSKAEQKVQEKLKAAYEKKAAADKKAAAEKADGTP